LAEEDHSETDEAARFFALGAGAGDWNQCLPGLVNVYKTNIAMERSTMFNGKTHYKWPFSIAMSYVN
jgi:hypothetical protein